ncbi:MAG: YggS family pyridoxal phosphate-dependent enzyme [Elusimicrobiaceae bacterium]|nr:YggS family pyridoxal phosphate-dependent enzyme [Elusimicrobiaceae bacterium]
MQALLQPAIAYQALLKEVAVICLSCGRDPKEVKILPVVKYANVPQIVNLLTDKSINYVAESRLQDCLKKWQSAELKPYKVKKFFIGRLQKNKTAKVLEYFDLICSLDNKTVAQFLNQKAKEKSKIAKCLVQVKLTGKDTQGGVSLEDAGALIEKILSNCQNIKLKGLMAIAPQASEDIIEQKFLAVKKLFDKYFKPSDILSLGMSEDYKIAIKSGSNLLRIGSKIFENSEE